jgi:DNA-binding response OmpR family regulator
MANQSIVTGSPHSCSVLVVEDECFIAMEIEILLEESGYRVIGPAASNSEALRILGASDPDVALLDANIGGHLVTPVAEELRRRHIPFVLSSAYTSFRSTGSRVLADATNIGKPISQRRLLAALAEATGIEPHPPLTE